jgi:hypothetical protein
MLIWGTKYSLIHQQPLTEPCRVCGKKTLTLFVYQPLFHLFWIPTFPLRKVSSIECSNCLTSFAPDTYGNVPIATHVRTPWWSFIGMGLFTFFLSLGILIERKENAEIDAFKQSPQPQYFIVYKEKAPDLEEAPYRYAKITDVKNGVVYMDIGSYSSSRPSGAKSTLKASRKSPEKYFGSDQQQVPLHEFLEFDITSVVKPDGSDIF